MQGFVDNGGEVLNEAKVKWKENTDVLAAVSMLCPCVVPSETGTKLSLSLNNLTFLNIYEMFKKHSQVS